MSGKQNGMRRVFGVKSVAEETPPERFVRPEGSSLPIRATTTQAVSSDVPRRSMSPKRYEQQQIEKARVQW